MDSSNTDVRVIDSSQLARARRKDLDIDPDTARRLGREAVGCIERGWYLDASGRPVSWSEAVEQARQLKITIAPDSPLPRPPTLKPFVTCVEIANETSLGAARRLVDGGLCPLVLNMANGLHPGGGFLHGSRAQEESLCRSSALYATLLDDPMYEAHARRPDPDSTDWAILSPDVPIFRTDVGTPLDQPWFASFVTSAAPYAPRIGQPAAGDLLDARIRRLLEIARAYRYTALVLGAWGCGAFHNDPDRTARDFRQHLDNEYAGVFQRIVFAITDWSADRQFLGPFVKAFGDDSGRNPEH